MRQERHVEQGRAAACRGSRRTRTRPTDRRERCATSHATAASRRRRARTGIRCRRARLSRPSPQGCSRRARPCRSPCRAPSSTTRCCRRRRHPNTRRAHSTARDRRPLERTRTRPVERSKPLIATNPIPRSIPARTAAPGQEPAQRRRHQHPVEDFERADDAAADQEERNDSQEDADADRVDRAASAASGRRRVARKNRPPAAVPAKAGQPNCSR